MLITGTSRGIGNYLAKHYLELGYTVFGCSRSEVKINSKNYLHTSCNISDSKSVKSMLTKIRKDYGGLDILINNAGIASMNHSLLTKSDTVNKIFKTNFLGTFLLSRESAKLMQLNKFGRIVNFTTVAVPLNLEGEAIYASSKAAVCSLTKILAKEFGGFNITVNAIGPTPIKTDLIKSIPSNKIDSIINQQAIRRYGTFEDTSNVIDFFISSRSDFITGQILYLGGL
ncbi:MAG: oxidoreductase [Rickettsiales bacterium]|nr:oxidoreductase [Rickettsiales bacterium]